MKRKITLAAVIAALLALAASLFIASRADAATSVTATASVTNHPDTTAASGPACTSSTNGPVWANDNYTFQITATPEANPANTYSVHIMDNGYFVAFADPNTCAALDTFGTMAGTYDLTVVSTTAPNSSNLKKTYNGAISTTQMVKDLFGGNPTSVTGGGYNFSYQNGNYVQDTSGQRGGVVKPTASGLFYVKNAYSGKCLDVKLGQYVPGGVIQQWQCGVVWEGVRGHNQKFETLTASGLQVLLAVPPTGSPLFVTTNGFGKQLTVTDKFTLFQQSGQYLKIGGLYFNDSAWSTANGASQIGWSYTGAANERYNLVAA